MLKSFEVRDDFGGQHVEAIEVDLLFSDGTRRWCYFMTPSAIAACGDWISGTNVRYHYDAPHMIVVAGILDHAVVERVLRDLDGRGVLVRCSRAIDEPT